VSGPSARSRRRTASRAIAGAALCLPLQACSPGAEQARASLERLGLAVEPATFVQAARTHGPTAMKLFVAAGVDPNRLSPGDGMSPLMAAAEAGRADNVKELIERGGSVRLRSRENMTALHYASLHCGNADSVKLLLEAGSDPNAADNRGLTPLMLFAYARPASRVPCAAEIEETLRKYGAREPQK
jgi:ankyrin repeat protein